MRSKEITLRIPKNTLKQLNFLAKNTNRLWRNHVTDHDHKNPV